jgi:hypothetical protein
VDPPLSWDSTRQREYFVWAAQVIDGLLGVNPALESAAMSVLSEGKTKFGLFSRP